MRREGHNLLKVLNVRAGFGREDDRFPALWMEPKVTPDGEVRLMDYYGRRELLAGRTWFESWMSTTTRGAGTRPTRTPPLRSWKSWGFSDL